MTPLIRVLRDPRGYSLVELLMVCAVLGMILAGIFVMQQQGLQAYLLGSHRVEVQQNNRVTLDMMVTELRSALSIVTLGSATDLTFTTCTDLTATSPCPPAAIATVMPATLLLRPIELNTLAVEIWERTSEAMWQEAAVPALTLVGVGLLPVVLLIRLTSSRR